jgi:diaminopimelate epimerase
MKFAKAHAYGNDFLYIEQSQLARVALDELARQMCDRHLGVGADGLIVYERAGEAVSMRLFNADGSRAEVSGNGVRALGAWILRDDPGEGGMVTIQTEAGVKELERLGRDGVRQIFRTRMGSPTDLHQLPLEAGGESITAVVLSIGNPQCVLLGPLPDDARFHRLGAALEHHDAFPEGTNVEFTQVETPDRVRIRIWERGVGPTLSSGTGSCAALIAAAAFGGANRDADVVAPGGVQRVEWKSDSVYLTGWAEVVCEGTWLKQIPRRP